MRIFNPLSFLAVVLLAGAWIVLTPLAPDETEVWAAVSSRKLEHEIGLVGRVEPVETSVLNAPFEGVVMAHELSPGMQVEEGQALLSFDTALLEIKVRDALANKLKQQQIVETFRTWTNGPQVAGAKRSLRVAELAMQNLDLELSQVEALYQKGIVPRNELDSLKQQRYLQALELTAATSELDNVLASGRGEARTIAGMELHNASVIHEQLNALLAHKTLYAPYSGVVLSLGSPQSNGGEVVTLNKGALFAMGQQVIKLGNMSGLKVVTQVSESDVSKFSLNQEVRITGEGFSADLSGYISAISQMAVQDQNEGSAARFPVTITVNQSSSGDFKLVRLGMSAHMTIVTYRNDNSFIIPHAAVGKDGDSLFVEHREELDAPVVRRTVTIGQSSVDGVEVFGVESGYVRVN